jgi:NAD(P)-dependent dehydrogenase (short-subunit alcohol dehydrogenase family)
LITGASGGIGQAAVQLFAAADWVVVGVDRKEAPRPAEGVRFVQADVSSSEDVSRVFGELARQEGRLDALVNNAAIQINKPILTTSTAEWDEVMASNMRSAYLTAKHGFDLLRAARGSIVNVSSVHALATSAGIAAYAASKGGLLALTRAMAIEFGPDGVRVNAVLPGAVDTPMLRESLGRLEGRDLEAKLQALGGRTPLGRVGRPAEIAEAILFLADGERSSFITGQALTVDGGAMAQLRTE